MLGTHGSSALKHLVLGSVAEEIFRRASSPVLTVGPADRKDVIAAGKLATILYVTDFSPASLNAFDYASSLARSNNAKLDLFHAMGSSEPQVEDVSTYVIEFCMFLARYFSRCAARSVSMRLWTHFAKGSNF